MTACEASILTILCILGNFFILLLSSADFFFKVDFFKEIFLRNSVRVSNGLDPDWDLCWSFLFVCLLVQNSIMIFRSNILVSIIRNKTIYTNGFIIPMAVVLPCHEKSYMSEQQRHRSAHAV